MTSYLTFAKAHENVPEAVSWMNETLEGVDLDRIVSITQSTTSDSGPGYGNWYMTTMVVIRNDEPEPPLGDM